MHPQDFLYVQGHNQAHYVSPQLLFDNLHTPCVLGDLFRLALPSQKSFMASFKLSSFFLYKQWGWKQ